MVITPMLQKGVDVNLPKAANTSDQKDKKNSVVVAIKLDTTIFLNGKAESVAELPAKLKERIAEQPDAEKIVYIKADINLAYSEVMKVMDLCREAGAEDVALITEKKVQS
jgi:biopolymer transport protein ExbD